MALQRNFIGWDQPAVPNICDQLLGKQTTGQTADLSSWLLVVPSARAKYRILEILVARCEQTGLQLTPPRIVTVGEFPEQLYHIKKPFANELTQKMAWVRAIQSISRKSLQHVFGVLPTSKEHPDWLHMAELIGRLHRELAGDVLSFEDVYQKAESLAGFSERDRWQALSEIQRKYWSILDESQLWDRQSARSYAIQHDQCQSNKNICLIAVADINQALRQMINQVANNSDEEVISYVFADASLADRFDQHGCLIPSQWQDAMVDIANDQIIVADRPMEQTEALVGYLSQLGKKYRAEQITIAMPQPELEPYIARQLSQHHLSARFMRGKSLAQSSVYKLLESVSDYLHTNRFEQMAALMRHPLMHNWIRKNNGNADFLTDLDKYQNKKLPTRVEGFLLSSDDSDHVVQHAFTMLDEATSALNGPAKPLASWRAEIEFFLGKVFGNQQLDREDPCDKVTLQAIEKVCEIFAEFDSVPEALMPGVNGTQMLGLVLQQLGAAASHPPADPSAIEAIGWLDLPLDDAPVAIVTGFNDGVIPSAEGSDMFLPNSIRESLGLLNDSRRYARDAYALTAILNSREKVVLIAGRRDAQNYPLSPSRLMFATDHETIAQRAQAFFNYETADDPKPGQQFELEDRPEEKPGGFVVPLPEPGKLVLNKLSPTGFRSYLACPYRFYLKRTLGHYATIDDRVQEMDGGVFGELMHWVMEEFGNNEIRDSTDYREIRKFLRGCVTRMERGRYRNPVKPAVTVQIENMRLRLDKFAIKQAEWRKQGWQIRYTEKEDLEYEMIVDGQPFTINGRVDRIDVHEETGAVFVFDYKSSDKAITPDKAHFKSNEWVDLQLPLYRHLVKQMPFANQENTKLGYICVPRALKEINFYPAQWTEEDLVSADEIAADVIRKLRAEIFWPPTDPAPKFSEDFAFICMDGVFDRPKFQEIDQLAGSLSE